MINPEVTSAPGQNSTRWQGLSVYLNQKLVWLNAIIAALLMGSAWAAELPTTEYSVKAAFLYRFADYVEWPPAAFDSPTSPLNVCVIGKDPFGSSLERLAEGERAAGRPIAIKRAQVLDEAMGCHVAYVESKGNLVSLLHAFESRPVLTVTDGVNETGAHGIINFVIHDNHVRFDIDMQLAATNMLGISSRLLSLALAVKAPGNSKETLP